MYYSTWNVLYYIECTSTNHVHSTYNVRSHINCISITNVLVHNMYFNTNLYNNILSIFYVL